MEPEQGTPLAALRRRVPWTQRELAAAAGVSLGAVRNLEQGAYPTVQPRVIRALAAALGVAPAAVAEFRRSLDLPAPPAASPNPKRATRSAPVARGPAGDRPLPPAG